MYKFFSTIMCISYLCYIIQNIGIFVCAKTKVKNVIYFIGKTGELLRIMLLYDIILD